MNPQLLNFFKEAWNRLGSKSPTFFFITKIIGASLALAGKIPWALDRWTNIEPSEQFITLCSDIGMFFAGVWGASFLPSQSLPVAQTKAAGEAITVTDEKKFPFTSNVESKSISESEPPVPVVDVPENK